MKEILNKEDFRKTCFSSIPLVWGTCWWESISSHTEVYAPWRGENKAFYCRGVGLCLWNGCCVNGDMCEGRKLCCSWQYLSPGKNKATHVVGCLSSTTISDIPKEPELGDGHSRPLGEKCHFVQKKNGMVYLRKLGAGGDWMTQRTMWACVGLARSWRR